MTDVDRNSSEDIRAEDTRSEYAGSEYDCLVLGAGPGGYVAAIRASQLGLKTAVIEREAPGGVCLNWGCIPTKALLKSAEVYRMLQHAADFGLRAENISFDFAAINSRSRTVVERMSKGIGFLFKKNKIDLIAGQGVFTGKRTVEVLDTTGTRRSISFKNAIIATGARARTLPTLPVDEERIVTYRKVLELTERPERLLIVGAGAIGIEFAYFFSSFGTAVTVVELLPQILPVEDEEVSHALQRSLTKAGIRILTGTTVEDIQRTGDTIRARLKTGDTSEEWAGDYCFVAVGVQGNSENLGLENLGVQPERSFIKVDRSYRVLSAGQTPLDGVYAVGDIIGPPLLAHVASHEGIIAAETIAGMNPHPLDYTSIPGCTYCQPQVASIGLTEKGARAAGKQIKIGKFPFAALGKAVATSETEGFIKAVIDAEVEEVLGLHILHAEATELIGEGCVIRSHEGVATSVLNTIHAHPTLSEGIMEAMGAALGRAIHS